MPSVYEKCCTVVEDTIKGCAWILPCWWQTFGAVSHFAVYLPSKRSWNVWKKKILKSQNFWRLRKPLRDKWVPSSYSSSYSRNPFGGRQCNNPAGRTKMRNSGKSEARGRVVELGNWTNSVNFNLEPDPGCTNGYIQNSTGSICFGLGWCKCTLKEGRLRLDTSSSLRGWWGTGTDHTKKFWMPQYWKCLRTGWMELWANWSSGTCPWQWQGMMIS